MTLNKIRIKIPAADLEVEADGVSAELGSKIIDITLATAKKIISRKKRLAKKAALALANTTHESTKVS